jgi:hypothetical protein
MIAPGRNQTSRVQLTDRFEQLRIRFYEKLVVQAPDSFLHFVFLNQESHADLRCSLGDHLYVDVI